MSWNDERSAMQILDGFRIMLVALCVAVLVGGALTLWNQGREHDRLEAKIDYVEQRINVETAYVNTLKDAMIRAGLQPPPAPPAPPRKD